MDTTLHFLRHSSVSGQLHWCIFFLISIHLNGVIFHPSVACCTDCKKSLNKVNREMMSNIVGTGCWVKGNTQV